MRCNECGSDFGVRVRVGVRVQALSHVHGADTCNDSSDACTGVGVRLSIRARVKVRVSVWVWVIVRVSIRVITRALIPGPEGSALRPV